MAESKNNTGLEDVLKEINKDINKSETSEEIDQTESVKNEEEVKKEDEIIITEMPLSELDKKQKKHIKAKLKREHGTAIARVKDTKKEEHSKKQRNTAILGAIVSFFVIVGIVSSVIFTVSFTGDLINSTKLKEELAKEVFPLVIIDVPEFSSPEMVDSTSVIAASIWKFIISEDDKSKYKTDEYGSIYLPAADVEYYVRSLFGSDVKIVHQSIDDGSVQMSYSEESAFYIIDSTPKYLPYTPRVDKIKRNGDIYTLEVSYIMPDALWNLENDINSKSADKVLEYTLKKVEDDYQVLSVKQIEIINSSSNTDHTGDFDDLDYGDDVKSDVQSDTESNVESGTESENQSSDVSSDTQSKE